MNHRRVRPFNTRDTYPEQRIANDLAQAVVAGNTVYLRGQVGQDIDTGESVAIGDPAGQAEQAMANVARLLALARDLLNSDYAGHRLTFQLFAQAPPFAHLAAVYHSFDFAGPLDLVRHAAGLSDRVPA